MNAAHCATLTANCRLLFTDTQLCNDGTIALDINFRQIVQQISSLSDHFQKAAAGVMILLVLPKMLGEIVDPLGQNGNLDLRGPGIPLMAGMLLNQICLFLSCHTSSPFCGKPHVYSPYPQQGFGDSPGWTFSRNAALIRALGGSRRLLSHLLEPELYPTTAGMAISHILA